MPVVLGIPDASVEIKIELDCEHDSSVAGHCDQVACAELLDAEICERLEEDLRRCDGEVDALSAEAFSGFADVVDMGVPIGATDESVAAVAFSVIACLTGAATIARASTGVHSLPSR
jgi:hypothetical protein